MDVQLTITNIPRVWRESSDLGEVFVPKSVGSFLHVFLLCLTFDGQGNCLYRTHRGKGWKLSTVSQVISPNCLKISYLEVMNEMKKGKFILPNKAAETQVLYWTSISEWDETEDPALDSKCAHTHTCTRAHTHTHTHSHRQTETHTHTHTHTITPWKPIEKL